MAATWSGEATSPTAWSPMAARRRAEWPTKKPALTPMRPSRRASHSPNDVQLQSRPSWRARSGIPSTLAIICERYAVFFGPHGARENPQLPPSTVVTPWSGDGLAVGSQKSWAS